MGVDWILQEKESRRVFANSTWVPLRASVTDAKGDVRSVGYASQFFGCGSVAFPPANRGIAESLSWSDIGLINSTAPFAYEDGHYSSIEEYEFDDKNPIGVHLVFEYIEPVSGEKKWLLNPDLVVALGLVKNGNDWVRPSENFVTVVKEVHGTDGIVSQIEIKREFLIDYLAARNLSLKLSYYRQRVENVLNHKESEYGELNTYSEERDEGRFELRVNALSKIYGGDWSVLRVWRTDVDEEEDAPVMGPESDENTDYEKGTSKGVHLDGFRIEGEFWKDEWIEHQNRSERVRGDAPLSYPKFIVDTDGSMMSSEDLNDEDAGRWLWFSSNVINELLRLRGFSFKWYTRMTGSICSTSNYAVHFGLNDSDFIVVYAYDIAKLPTWEQRIWAAHNVLPEGKVSRELLDAQVSGKPAKTLAPEEVLVAAMDELGNAFYNKFSQPLFNHEIKKEDCIREVSRFKSIDQKSLLALAKELVRVFSDRLNTQSLRKVSTKEDKKKLGTIKLLEGVLSNEVGKDAAYSVFGPIVGVYELRLGDAHPTSSKIREAYPLIGIDEDSSYLKQGEQMIVSYLNSIISIYRGLL
jgi:hypothetical protein